MAIESVDLLTANECTPVYKEGENYKFVVTDGRGTVDCEYSTSQEAQQKKNELMDMLDDLSNQ